jgi:4a-hydroxytetrahydrobiopterin dehydratase
MNPPIKLGPVAVVSALAQLTGWQLTGDGPSIAIEKTYSFASYRETIFFVNAVAFIAEQLNHHPDLSVHHSRCVVRFSTHDAAGLTRADFDSAARIDALIPPAAGTAPPGPMSP